MLRYRRHVHKTDPDGVLNGSMGEMMINPVSMGPDHVTSWEEHWVREPDIPRVLVSLHLRQ